MLYTKGVCLMKWGRRGFKLLPKHIKAAQLLSLEMFPSAWLI